MPVIRLPKKLKDAFTLIRQGNIESGVEKINAIPGFEPQKNIALAEISYFKSDFDKAMSCDESALMHDDEWYAGNILTEHFEAYTYAAMASGQIKRAEQYYLSFLEKKLLLDLPEHMINQYKYLTQQHILKLSGEINLPINPKPLAIIQNGAQLSELEASLKENRPDLVKEGWEKIDYLLYFMILKSDTADVFKYYEDNVDEIRMADRHLDVARLYALTGYVCLAQKALLRYSKLWWPVEHMQVLPLPIFEYEEFRPLLDEDFRREILVMEKGVK